MKIQVKSVGPITSKQGPKAAYSVFELIYASDGRVGTRNIMEFSKDAFNALKDAVPGSWFNVTTVKDKTGKYWNWEEVTACAADAPVAQTGGQPSPGAKGGDREFETAAERALKQIYIVRQSSITNAIAFLAGKKSSTKEVLATAKLFENYVFDSGVTLGNSNELDTQEPELEEDIE